MRSKKPHVARLDEVRIVREIDTAIISYVDPAIAITHLRIGPELGDMSDKQILERFNEVIVAQQWMAASYDHVAVEVPPGRPQLKYFKAGHQWVPRGHVLRCLIHDDGSENKVLIEVDDQELSLDEFGRMLATYAGWGMRICFVPDDELEREPKVEVREPDAEHES